MSHPLLATIVPAPVTLAARSALPTSLAVFLLCVVLFPGFVSCSGDAPTAGSAARRHSSGCRRIVASIAPLADLARRVGGESVEVLTLVPAGVSEHAWDPAPRDVARLGGIDLFFQVGLGFEPWAGKLVEVGGSPFTSVDASAGIEPIYESESQLRPSFGVMSGSPSGTGEKIPLSTEAAALRASAGAGEHARYDGRVPNPHYWLDPVAMKPGVTRLGEALARLDPERAAEHRARAARTSRDLDALDEEIRTRTARFTSRKIVTFHPAWDYFARRYRLDIVASIEESPGKEPGPRRIAEIVRRVRAEGVRAIFAEPQYPSKAAQVIASECGISLRVLDPLGGESVPGRSDYFSLLRYNVGVMEEALR